MADNKIFTSPIEESSSQVDIQNQSGPEDSAALATITIPDVDVVEVVNVKAGAELPIAFSLDDAEVEIVEGDLRLDFDNGSTLILQDFVALSEMANPPSIVMADGTVLPGDAVIFPYLDAAPAAGPTVSGGGIGTYRDDLGQVIEGVDRLGTQGPPALDSAAGTELDDQSLPLEEDSPPDAVDDMGSTDEGGTVIIPVLTNDSDPDGDALSIVSFTQPTLGSVTQNSDNTFTYDTDGNFEALNTGDTATETFTYTITDGHGGTDTATITITINGTNDSPIAVADNNLIVELADDIVTDNAVTGNVLDGNSSAGSDSVDDNDPSGDSLFADFFVASVDGTAVGDGATSIAISGDYGALTINGDGSYSYELDDANSTVQALNSDSTAIQDVFSYTMNDGDGGTDTANLTITINGTNDSPIAVADNNLIVELADDIVTDNAVTGNVLDGNSSAGSDSVDDNDPSGDSLFADFFVASVDGTAVGDGATSIAISGDYGALTINGDGSYSYELDDANSTVQALNSDSTAIQDVFSYTMNDGDGGTDTANLTITINGTNDSPIAVADNNLIVELADDIVTDNAVTGNVLDGNSSAGSDSVDDNDPSGDSLFADFFVASVDGTAVGDGATSIAISGDYGALTINGDGSYSYELDDANSTVQALNSDSTAIQDVFSYTMNDGDGGTDTANLTITINGTNDSPIAVADNNLIVELADDIVTDNAVTGNVLDGNSSAGSDSVDDNDPSGDSLFADFFVASVDGTAVGDGATSIAISGDYGALTINGDGSYSYELDDANSTVQALNSDSTAIQDVFSYTMNDGDGGTDTANLTITINGTNDSPIAVADNNLIVELADDIVTDNAVTGNVLDGNSSAGSDSVDDNDPSGDSLFADFFVASVDGTAVGDGATSIAISGDYGALTINGDGSYSYELDDANSTVQALNSDSTAIQDVFSYTMNDGDGGTDTANLTITINGTNDSPIAVADNNLIVELADDIVTDNAVTGNVLDGNSSAGSDSVDDNDPSGDSLFADFFVASVDGTAVGDGATSIAISGDYGALTINGDGSYSYELDDANSTVQALNSDSTAIQDVFSYTMNDGDGGTDTANLTITINGTNDSPIAVADNNLIVELADDIVTDNAVTGNVLDGNSSAGSDSVDDNDPSGDSLFADFFVASVDGTAVGDGATSIAISGDYGALTINGDGSYSYELDDANSTVQALNSDSTAIQDVFSYTMNDGDGGTDTANLTITINGTNDSPIAVADNNLIVELADDIVTDNAVTGNVLDGNSSAGSDSVDDNDPSGDSLFADFFVASVDGTAVGDGATSIAISGDYGALTINGDGSYSYELDDANSTVQALNSDSTAIQDVFSYTMNDGDGGTDTANLTITINGTNDSPIAVADNNLIVELADDIVTDNAVTGNVLDGNSSAGSDSVDDNDPSGDSLFADFFVASVDGTAVGDGATSIAISGDYGALTINGDGSYSYELDDANSTVQALNSDSTAIQDVFSYTMNDGDGGTDTANLTITINGTNDSPIAVADNNLIVELADDIVTDNAVTGNVLDGNSSAGSDSVDDNDPSGDSLFADFFVASVDGTAVGDGATSIAISGDYGALTINGDGSYSYELDDANSTVQALNSDSTAIQDVFSYTMNDGDGGTDTANLTITINGTNDSPIAVADNNLIVELADDIVTDNAVTGNVLDGNSSAGSDSVDDNDPSGDSLFADFFVASVDGTAVGDGATSIAISGDYGALTINGDGSYSYELDDANSTVQALNSDSTAIQDVFSYTMNDGDGGTDTANLTITINGTNDSPIAVADNNLIVELADDIVTDNAVTGNVLDGNSSAGSDSVDDNDPSGDSLFADFFVASVDGTAVGDGGTSIAISGDYGALTINGDGSYSYELDDANSTVQALNSDSTAIQDVFSYTMNDGDGGTDTANLTITINGTNDSPIAVADNNLIVELADDIVTDNAVTGNVLDGNSSAGSDSVDDNDPSGDSLFADFFVASVDGTAVGDGATSIAISGDYGALTINGDGSYSYELDDANSTVQALNSDSTAIQDVFSYTMNDGDGGTDTANLTITINGTNDSPIAVADNNLIVELADDIVTDNAVTGNVLDGNSSAGSDSVDDNDPSGDSLFADFFVASVDGTAVGDGATSIAISGDYGALTINGDGSYSYELDDANSTVQALNSDSTAIQDVFSYTMNDGDGGTDTANLTITINGTNDSPIAVADNNLIVELADDIVTDNAVTGNVLDGNSSAGSDSVDDNDPSGDSLFADFFVASVDGTAVGDGATSIAISGDYGALTINGDGSYSYELDDANSTVQALNSDSTAIQDVFSYTMNDGDGGTDTANLTITINGTNDSPIAVADNNLIVELADDIVTDNAVTGNVLDGNSSAGSDSVDDNDPSGDSLFADFFVASVDGTAVGDGATSIAISGDYGALTINGDGSYSYELDDANSTVQALNSDSTAIQDVFSYTMNDGDGGTDTANLTITINGTNDSPIAVADNNLIVELADDIVTDNAVTGNVLDGNSSAGSDSVDDNDPSGDSLFADFFVASVDGTAVGDGATSIAISGDYGALTINGDGSYSYELDDANSTVQALNSDSTAIQDVFSYTMNDGDGGTDTANLTITINGTNDSPIAVADNNLIVELADDIVTDNAVTGNVLDGNSSAGSDSVDDNDPSGDSLFADFFVASVDGTAVGDGATSIAISGDYGALTINGDGSYSYELDDANSTVQALNSDSTAIQDVFSYTMNDGDGGTDTANLTITINGTNDSPIAVADNNLIVELADDIVTDNAVTGNVLDGNSSAGSDSVDDNDPSGDSLFADFFVASVDGTAVGDGATSIAISGDYGALTINGDGSYSYELDDANSTVQALNSDSTAIQDVFSYTMNDGDGGTDTANLTITINGTNDSPIAVADNNLIVELADDIVTDNAVTGNVLDGNSSAGSDSVDDNDPSGDSLFADFFVASVDGTAVGDGATSIAISGDYGALTINGDGSYSYELDDANSTVQALNSDSTAIQDVFSYTMNDGDGGTDTANLTITINGTNDSPIAVADNNLIVELADDIVTDNAVTGNVLDGNSSAGSDSVDDNDPSGDSLFADFFVASVDGTAVGDGATSIAISGDYGALTINGDGSYSYELDDANSTVQALNSDSTAIQDVFSYTMNDGDGGTDTANLTITINGADDLATLVATNTTVSEEGLEFGNLDLLPDDYVLLPGDDVLNNPNDNTNLTVNTGTFTLTDIDTVYTVDDISLATAAALLTTDGVAVNFAWNAIADALIGTRDDNDDEVIRVSVDSVTPSFDNYVVAYTVILSAPIEHPFTGDGSAVVYDESVVAEQDEDEITFNIDVTAGSTTFMDAFEVTVEDDSPINIVPEDAVLSNLALESFTGDLDFDAQVEDNIGADQPANVRFPVSLESLADTGLTSGGLEISYDVSGDGQTLTGYTVAGNVFTIALNVDAAGVDQYTVTMIGTVDGGASVIDFNAGGYDFVGGNGAWAGFNTDADDDSQDLLLTPIGAGTVNTNANEGGVGGGNSVGPTEAIRADFVIDLEGDPKGTPYTDLTNQDHTFDSHYQVNGSSVLFTQTDGTSVIVKAFDDADGNDVGDGVQDAITAVGISYGGEEGFVSFAAVGTTTEPLTLNGHVFNVTFDGIEVQIDGVISDSMISTFTADGYNSVEYWHAGGETFKVGDFGTTVIDPGEPVEFSVPLDVVDADGDIADGTIDVLLTPPDAFDAAESSQMLILDDSAIYEFSANGGEGDLVIDGFNVDTDVLRLTDVLDLDSDGTLDLDDVAVGVAAQGNDLVLTIAGSGGVDTSVTLTDVGEYQGVDSLDSLAQAGFQVEYTG